jgi:hypothetical protein
MLRRAALGERPSLELRPKPDAPGVRVGEAAIAGHLAPAVRAGVSITSASRTT